VFPKRVVIEGEKKSETITLSNTGKDTAKYNISYIQIRMKEDGSFENITEPDSGQNFAKPYLRFFPRSVTLAPNESQVVKIQLIRGNELKPGEYRSHLYFRAVPKVTALGENNVPQDTTTISVKIVPVFGITIANIIRVGESTTKVSITNLAIEKNEDSVLFLKMDINRTGNMSVYGDMRVVYTSPTGKNTEVAYIQGLAVYSPGTRRITKVELKSKFGIDYKKGTLKVTYSTQPEAKNITLAEQSCILNNMHWTRVINEQHK
jgi:hypothetical protein